MHSFNLAFNKLDSVVLRLSKINNNILELQDQKVFHLLTIHVDLILKKLTVQSEKSLSEMSFHEFLQCLVRFNKSIH